MCYRTPTQQLPAEINAYKSESEDEDELRREDINFGETPMTIGGRNHKSSSVLSHVSSGNDDINNLVTPRSVSPFLSTARTSYECSSFRNYYSYLY